MINIDLEEANTQSPLWFINFVVNNMTIIYKSDDIIFAVYMGAYVEVSMTLPNELQMVYGGSFFYTLSVS